MDEAVTLPEAESAVATAMEYDGIEKYAVDLQRPGTNQAAASSYIEADVIRRSNLVNQNLVGE
jgi:hypothetical protein